MKARGSLLFMTGRSDFYEKYLETFADFRAQGWNITTADWRGQGGSGRLGPVRDVGHVADFALWVDDLAALFAEWRESSPGPHILLGHSMGGHLVLRALIEKRVAPDAAILSAPMLVPRGRGWPLWLSYGLAWLMTKLGPDDRHAWKVSDKPLEALAMRQNLITHDVERYADEAYWLDRRPELRGGPPSWRWIEQAFASGRRFYDAEALSDVMTPLLILGTRADRLVDTGVIETAAAALPHAESFWFGAEARHELFREVDTVRDAALDSCFRFLDRIAPNDG